MNSIWNGEISIDSVEWTYSKSHPNFPEYILNYAKESWKTKILQFPQLYDGDVLWLNSHSFSDGRLHLETSTIKYSQVLALHDLEVIDFCGQFGFKAIISNSNGKLLVGNRAYDSEFKPGFYQMPGGIFELSDLSSPIEQACRRELEEELLMNVNNFYIKAIALIVEFAHVGIQFVISCQLNLDDTPLKANEEWQDNILRWYSLEEINELPQERILEGLDFIRNSQ